MPNQQLVRHTATVLRRWREATNISMKTFRCYDIVTQFYGTDTASLAWAELDRQAPLWKIAMRGQQITFKPNCFKNFLKYTSVHNAKVIYIFHWSLLQLPTILMVSILDWITACIVDVCISYKTINILTNPLNK